MRNNLRIKSCFVLLPLLAFALAAGRCNRTRESSPSPAHTPGATNQALSVPEAEIARQVVVLTAGAFTTLDPYRMVSVHPEDSVAVHLWDTLIWLNDDLELEPRLAESWRLINDVTWEFKLRQDVTFQNGEPFNARAVKFSLERAAQLPDSLETFASDVGLRAVEIVDDYTVRILTAGPAVSMIYEISAVEMLPPDYYAQTALDDLAHNPVGSGPYRLTGWDADGRLVLEANSDYWQGPPVIHTLVFEAEVDVDKRLSRLAEGDADLITDIPPDQAEMANTERTRLEAIEGTRRLFVGLRSESGTPLADKRVRQALNYAVDVQSLVTKFHAGYGQRYGSWVNPPHNDPNLSPWPYDPEKARGLLIQAGYIDGLELAMDSPVGRYYRDQEIAEAIAAQLAEVGVTVDVQPWEWSTYTRERLIPKETAPLFLLTLMSRGNGLEDAQNLAHDFPFQPTLWYNGEFEQLLSQAAETFNQSLRLNLLQEAQAIAYEEAPWIWLWRPFLFYGVSQDLEWWQPRADGLIYLYTSAPEASAE